MNGCTLTLDISIPEFSECGNIKKEKQGRKALLRNEKPA